MASRCARPVWSNNRYFFISSGNELELAAMCTKSDQRSNYSVVVMSDWSWVVPLIGDEFHEELGKSGVDQTDSSCQCIDLMHRSDAKSRLVCIDFATDVCMCVCPHFSTKCNSSYVQSCAIILL